MIAKRIGQLALALEQAADDEYWDEIRRIDAQISQLLETIKAKGLQNSLCDALNGLRRSHLRVAKICHEQRDLLQMKIEQHQQKREGLQAYTLFSADNEELL